MAALLIIHCSLFINLSSQAQTFTQQLQKNVKGEGIVKLHQDQAITDLVNGPKAVKLPAAATVKPTIKKEVNIKPKTLAASKKKENTTAAPVRNVAPDTAIQRAVIPDTATVKPKRTYRTTGYRVQVFAGGNSRRDRQKAEQIGNQLRTLFPDQQVYVHFYSPRWLCRIGNYKDLEEASRMKSELKQMGFGSTTIVKGKITLPY